MDIFNYLEEKKQSTKRFGAGVLTVGMLLSAVACNNVDDNLIENSTGIITSAQQVENLAECTHKPREIIDAITMTHHLVDTVCEDCGYVLEDDKMVEHDYERTYESFDEELHGWETTCKVCGTYHPNATGVTNHWFVKNADGKEVCEDCGYELVE